MRSIALPRSASGTFAPDGMTVRRCGDDCCWPPKPMTKNSCTRSICTAFSCWPGNCYPPRKQPQEFPGDLTALATDLIVCRVLAACGRGFYGVLARLAFRAMDLRTGALTSPNARIQAARVLSWA